jgi:hypothetical protein
VRLVRDHDCNDPASLTHVLCDSRMHVDDTEVSFSAPTPAEPDVTHNRWLEDAISSFRAFAALVRLLRTGKPTLDHMRIVREGLHERVMDLSINSLGLPADPETHFLESGGKHKGRVSTRWEAGAKYFSLRRRRKRDWNETLRLYDKVDFPDEE